MAWIDQGSQWLIREPKLPESWRQVCYVSGRMLANALQHIDQISVRIDVVQLTGTDQALNDAHMFSPQFSPTEHPVFLAHGNGPQGPFQVVSIWLYLRIFQEHRQAGFPAEHVVQGFSQRFARQQATVF